MSKLVIVESPAKANTIKKYLGKGYNVVASMGHVRDLPKSRMGVDIENGFTPEYISIRGKAPLIRSLKKEAKKSDKVYLATDPDREGEAISWHLSKILDIGEEEPVRVTFNEITKAAVKDGIKHPRSIDLDLVNAQQARRILDRIVGYKLSPFLWKKVKRGLSAGRVQSVAVRIIADREDEIHNFKPQEYWTIDAAGIVTKTSKKEFAAKFYGDKNGKIAIENKEQADAILEKVKNAQLVVATVKKSERKKQPSPPFTTSTLQQEASKRLNFQAKKTMSVAQQLYEGINVKIKGYGTIGLITYMRTDSLRIADEARQQASQYIKTEYGEDYLPQSPRVYKTKKGAQDAHEAIRPTVPELSPQKLKESLTNDQYKLYKLIWERFIASQMANEIFDTVSADIDAAGYIFKASGSIVKFKGFAAVYQDMDSDASAKPLPALKTGDALTAKSIEAAQHFTQPPARYTEASLIKTLEENGIGRPSTYAPTITTILSRGYVTREGRQLLLTPLGEITTKLMREHFPDIVNIEFTAKMEDDLDRVETGKQDWVQTLSGFYDEFSQTLKKAEEELGDVHMKVPDEVTDVICENCGRHMVVKIGRYGKFLACPGFPECRNTKPIVQETGAFCPVCGARVLKKKSKTGKTYYGCENNPKCGFMTWEIPQKEVCPKCGSSLFKKNRGGLIHCLKEGCGFVQEGSGKS